MITHGYGVAVMKDPNEFFLIHGPFGSLKEAKAMNGNPYEFIVGFAENATTKLLYRWHPDHG